MTNTVVNLLLLSSFLYEVYFLLVVENNILVIFDS